LAPSSSVANGSITYHMFLVSDVSLNGQLFQNASIHLSFQSNTSRVTPLALGGPNGYINTHGVARVDIKSGTSTVSAEFARGQIYVYFDPMTASAGFGSVSGGRGYPAALFPTVVHQDTELLAAVADILNGGTTYYTPETIDLANATDLKHETMLAEYVSSCGNFDFSIGVCNDLINFPKLITDQVTSICIRSITEIALQTRPPRCAARIIGACSGPLTRSKNRTISRAPALMFFAVGPSLQKRQLERAHVSHFSRHGGAGPPFG
jgi:hypothetical protein